MRIGVLGGGGEEVVGFWGERGGGGEGEARIVGVVE